jgi:predicted dehydrogenase
MGFIGMGKQSRGLLGNFMNQEGVEVVAVCDVDTTRREAAKSEVEKHYAKAKDKPSGWKGCDAYNEFEKITGRDDIDAVCIATPDHWHAVGTIAALENGQDVYCEKPLTHNIHESIAVMDAVEKNGRVLQTGSMQRSSIEFRVACELVRNGAIGKVERVTCSFGDPGKPCDLETEKEEPGLDWDRWCGPGPLRGYSSVLSPRGMHNHFPDWRNYMEYGGGMVTDWGAHHLDIAQWGLGMDDSGPVETRPPEGWEQWKSKRGATHVYANGITVTHGNCVGGGVQFFGSEGEVMVNRGKFAIKIGDEFVARFLRDGNDDRRSSLGNQVAKARDEFLKNPEVKLYRSDHHVRDFLSAVRKRSKPITNEIVGARTAICCHLMNQAYYHGEVLKWDPAGNAFTDGTGNASWLTREYRGPWKV